MPSDPSIIGNSRDICLVYWLEQDECRSSKGYVLGLKYFHLSVGGCIFQFSFTDTRPAYYAGTVFAYGVTSSGKTHTMHVSLFFWDISSCPWIWEKLPTSATSQANSLYLCRNLTIEKVFTSFSSFVCQVQAPLSSPNQLKVFVITTLILRYWFPQGDHNSPGIIPLAIKDVFSIIQDVSQLTNLCYFKILMARYKHGSKVLWHQWFLYSNSILLSVWKCDLLLLIQKRKCD